MPHLDAHLIHVPKRTLRVYPSSHAIHLVPLHYWQLLPHKSADERQSELTREKPKEQVEQVVRAEHYEH